MKKKILSILLALALCLSLLPTMAWAGTNEAKIGTTEYETLTAAIAEVQDNETIVMLQDVTCGTPITINNGKTFTIDFKDGSTQHTFTWNVTSPDSQIDQDIFTIQGNSNVTVKNMTFLVGDSEEQGNRIFKVNTTGTLTLSGMTSNDENGKRNIPVLNNGGTVTIDGGNITTDNTNTTSITPNGLNPIVQNLNNGTTTFKGNGTYTTASSTGAVWIGRLITDYSNSTDTDRDSNCGTVIIENGTFNGGQIVDVNGGGTVTINNATTGTQSGPAIKTFRGGIKSKITINNITSSTAVFTQVIEELKTQIDFKNGNVKYTYFCIDQASQPMTSVSIKNGKFGPKSGNTDIGDEIQGFLDSSAKKAKLTSDPNGYTYKVGHCHDDDDNTVFLPWTAAQTAAGDYYLTEDVTLSSKWEVPAGTEQSPAVTNLCLNGHVIKRTGSGSVIEVPQNATLNLYDCDTRPEADRTHTGYVDATGLWHWDQDGTHVLQTGETAKTITGGVITGGNVEVSQLGNFTMTGGTIAGSTGTYGGVYVNSSGSFTMTGGTITGNTVNFGGVYVDQGSFTMTGGEITGNTGTYGGGGGGVCVGSGSVTLGGTAKITGNKKSDGTANNLYLPADNTVTISAHTAPAEGMQVGVTTQTPPTDVSPVKFASTTDASLIKYFTSDSDSYYVTHSAADSALQLAVIGSNVVQNLTTGMAYTSLAGAITNASSAGNANDTLKLLANVTENVTISGKALTLDLNGKVLKAQSTNSVIKVESTGNLTLIDSNPTAEHKFKDSDTTTGLWVLDDTLTDDAVKHTVKGGVITGGKAENSLVAGGNNGGGVLVDDGSFTMSGGNIVGNSATDGGGGVGVYGIGNLFTMNGGTISGNYAGTNGGGVSCCGSDNNGYGSFTITNGRICDNVAKFGGGIQNNGGTLKLSAAAGETIEITGNKATDAEGGVANWGKMHLSGKVIIKDNTAPNGTPQNLGISSYGGNPKAIIDGLLTGSDIHVSHMDNEDACDTGVLTSGFTTKNPGAKLGDFFTYDGPSTYEMVLNNGELEVKEKPAPPAPPAPSGGNSNTVTVPVSGDKDSVKVQATVSGSNATVKNVTSEQLEKVGTGENVTIDLSSLNKSVSGVTIPKTTLENVAASDADGLEVKLPNGTTAVFDSTTVAAVAEQAAGSSIQLVVDKENKAERALTAAQKETVKALNDALVLDAYFVSNGKRISDFKGGEAELTVSYPTTKPVRVWYVASDGSKTLVPSTFDGKSATFVVTHFSHYAIELLDGSSYATCPKDATCPISKFTDTKADFWWHDGIHYCLDNGLMNGVSDTQFAPNATLTRGMVVTVLARLNGVAAGTGNAWYVPGQEWAVANGISDGTNMTANITREQLATMLYRYAQFKGVDTGKFTENTNTLSHNDVFTIREWAAPGMHFCIAAGVVNGDNYGNLNPRSTATRAEAATMFQRFCENVTK